MQYMCSKTGYEGSIYAARQGMRACNNTNIHNPTIKDEGGLRMLVLLHALIPCLAAYILPSSPVLLHIYCPHPLSCCIYTPLIPCLAAYILPSSPVLLHIYCPHPLSCCIYTALVFLLFGTVIPTSSTFNGNVFTPAFLL